MWLLLVSVAFGGPWTRDLGSVYSKVGADWFRAGAYVAPSASDQATKGFLGTQFSAYVEAGLSPAHPIQLSVSVPLATNRVEIEQEDAFGRTTGTVKTTRMGDIRIRPQVALHPDLPLAAAVDLKIPLYQVDSICAKPAQIAYQDICPRPGDGQIDISEWMLAGAAQGKAFGELGLGYMHRTEWFIGWNTRIEVADNMLFSAGGGAWLLDRILLMAKCEGNIPVLRDGLTPGAIRLGPALLVDIVEGFALEARLQRDVWVVNNAKGTGYGFGLSWRRPS